jgi:hypothetical protein
MAGLKTKVSAAALAGVAVLGVLAAPSAASAATHPGGTWYYGSAMGSGTSEDAAIDNAWANLAAEHCDPVRLEWVDGSGTTWTAEVLGMCYLA